MRSGKKVHVVMLPWLAFGHMVPFLDLSMAIAKRGVHVSFISTPLNILRLPKIPPNLAPFLQFIPLPLHHPLLPPSAEATVDLPAHQIDHLKSACDALHHPVRAFVAANNPDYIVVDFFHHWAADLKTPLVIFQVLSAATSLFFLLVGGDKQASTVPQDVGSKVAYMEHEADAMHQVFTSDGERFGKLLAAASALAIRSCDEFEGEAIRSYSEKSGKQILPVGILPPEIPDRRSASPPWDAVFGWLDGQKAKSVVFVGFGSETKLSKEHIHEIAHGLEQSKLPFLWALRKPEEIEESDVLPEGFEKRTEGQGVVQMGWAPQRELLGHGAIGASLFHAGWGSIIEAMQFGHVLVFLPFIIDQPLNARMMVDKGLGIEVERAKDGSFGRGEVATALTLAIGDQTLRARTERATKDIFTNHKLHDLYLDRLVLFFQDSHN
ncbi:hypothetical protein SASPL_108243 [Salvia splendens]|uniref:Glycosyltransferase N-terminal domain-containing protein n=1 Tax=Salvia splendens TaxID=180675 RepID=A0A8X9A796_SALSN|nr:UDP-glycosyltransferase 91C1-like [Salvia splendens]KAG6430181.1 hypothetical protein SASPL_108243 [Salvia splendens]